MTGNSSIKRHLITAAIWLVLILGISAIVHINRARQAQYEQALSSQDAGVRDALVLELAKRDGLVDVLTNTEDPNEDTASVHNVASAKLRKQAVDSVNRLATSGKLTLPEAMRNLFLLSKDPDKDVNGAAKDALAALCGPNPDNLKTLVAQLKSGDPDIRGAARDVLGKIGGLPTAQLVDPLVSDPIAAGDAQETLAKIGAAAIPLMGAHLNAPKADVRKKFTDMLGTIGTPATISYLLPIANSDPDLAVRRTALISLTKIVISSYDSLAKATADTADAKRKGKTIPWTGPSDADMVLTRNIEPLLIHALTDTTQDSSVRAQAALTLGRTASPLAVQTLVASLSDYDATVAQAAKQGVQSTGPQAVDQLIAVLGTGSDAARRNAADALGGIGGPAAIAALTKLLNDHSTPGSIRIAATKALGRTENVAVIPQLIQVLGDSDGNVSSAAQEALVSSSFAETAIPQLIAAFSQPTPVPINASQTLVNMGTMAIPALKTALARPDVQTQLWAAVTLGQSNGLDAGATSALKALQSSPNDQVRFAASQALARASGASS